MKRGSPPRAAMASRLTDPTSVTAESLPAASSASAASRGRAPTGAAQKTTSAPSTASATEAPAELTAPSCSARASSSPSGSNPATSASSLLRAASPIEPPISPTPRTAMRIPGQPASRRFRTAAASRSSASTVVSQSMQASVIDWP